MVGISLLLFLLGIFSYILALSTSTAESIKEQLMVDIDFREDAREVDILKMEKELAAKPYVLSAQYVSKDSSKALMMRQMGDETFDILDGSNPIKPSIAVNLSAEYVNVDSAKKFEENIMSGNEHLIEDVYYNEKQFMELSDNFKNIKVFILILAGLLVLITMALINNTIRLAVYSKRFTIKTMQLVGAKPGFIRRPFLLSAIGQGFLSGIIAVLLLIGFGYLLLEINPDWGKSLTRSEAQLQKEFQIFAYLFGGIVLIGMFISWISTYFALSKYIWIKTDKLY